MPFEPAGSSSFDTEHNGHGHNDAGKNGHASKEAGDVLNELILALMRRGALTEEEGKTMVLRLLHRDFLS